VSTPSVATTHLPAVASIPATINIPMPITSPNPRDSRPPSLADAQHAVMIVLETLAFYGNPARLYDRNLIFFFFLFFLERPNKCRMGQGATAGDDDVHLQIE